jgi:hypothetical protein
MLSHGNVADRTNCFEETLGMMKEDEEEGEMRVDIREPYV